MKKLGFLTILIATIGLSFAFVVKNKAVAEKKVKWYTWEEATAANKVHPKKIFVDVYTNWCHWCKVMDKKTFEQADVAKYLNENFYPVKLNAEQKEAITFQGKTFKWQNQGRNGIHELAYALLNGQMSFPSVVFLNEKFERIAISPGYIQADEFLKQLKYAAEEHYKKMSYRDYSKSLN